MHVIPHLLQRWVAARLNGGRPRVRTRPAPRRLDLEQLEDRTPPTNASAGGLAAAPGNPDGPMPGNLTPRHRHLHVHPARPAPASAAGFRPIDGTGNNLAHPGWGSAGTDLLRVSPAGYADGVSAPSLPQDQSARAISNILNEQTDPNNPSQDLNTVDRQSLSDFGYAFGQFMDHDMDLTPDGGASFPIAVAAGDPLGPNALPFTRSQFDPKTGTGPGNPRQQVNAVTSFLDLSQVYGSDAATADALRTHAGGRLKTSPGNLLPYLNSASFTPQQLAAFNRALGGEQNLGGLPTSQLFATGDIRGNENLELTALQTLFVRNHNRIAAQLRQDQPTWGDERLYQEARKINIAEYQNIVYNEWIPAVLGPDALPAYAGYDPAVNPGIANEFSTVAFRFGHSLLSGNIERHGNNGLDIADVNPGGAAIDLAQDFFDPTLLNPNGVVDPATGHTSSGIDAILKGDADGNSQAMDLLAIREVRSLLFGNAGAGGQDLIARDLQRARDNGLPDYNTMRVAYGLAPVTSFAQITSDVRVQQELQQAYGSVANIDPFEGGLAEDHVAGSDVGPLFQAIVADQFARLRDGDRFFYLNERWSPEELSIFRQGDTLTRVIERNTGVTNLQDNAFVFRASIGGTVFSGVGRGARGASPGQGLAGATVELEDGNGNVLATTVTDGRGHYRFDQLNGVSATGEYTVRLVVPSGFTQTSADPPAVPISRGDDNVSGVNFVVAPAGQGTAAGTHAALDGGLVDAVFATARAHHRSPSAPRRPPSAPPRPSPSGPSCGEKGGRGPKRPFVSSVRVPLSCPRTGEPGCPRTGSARRNCSLRRLPSSAARRMPPAPAGRAYPGGSACCRCPRR